MLEQVMVRAVDNFGDDFLKEGEQYNVKAHPIDKSKWYIVSENNNWTLHERWRFEHLIDQYAICERHFGLFQLPILEEDKYHYTVVLPSGYVSLVSKEECKVENYTYKQRIN